jgi:hypothetical protein
MALSAEEGAKALYRLIYEADPDAPPKKARCGGSGGSTKRKSYQFPLIGIKSVEELKSERRIEDKGVEAAKTRGPCPRAPDDSAAHATCAAETPAKREKLPRDKHGKAIKECRECHEMRGIIGRGLCAKCYWRQPKVREAQIRKQKARRPKKKEGSQVSDAPTSVPESAEIASRHIVNGLSLPAAPGMGAGIPSAATRRRKPAHNKKPPVKIKCPCGVVFEVPAWRAKRAKYHSLECCTKYRASNYKGPAWTPEMDTQIAKVYQEQVGEIRRGNPCPPVRALAESLGMPRWCVSRRALELGLIAKARKEPAWSAEELAFLKAHGRLTWNVIQLKLKQAGFVHRSVNGIKIKFQRIFGNKPHEGYTCREVGKLFSIDAHGILGWIETGLLRAEHRGTARLPANGGDMWLIREADVRQFVIDNVELIDFRKLDKFWLVELLSGGEASKEET